MIRTVAKQALVRRLVPLALLYLAGVAGGGLLIRHFDLAGMPAYLLAILMSLPLLASIFALFHYVTEETDEYVRMMFVRDLVVATGFMLMITTVWGVLELATDVPPLPVYYVMVIWCVGLGLSQLSRKLLS